MIDLRIEQEYLYRWYVYFDSQISIISDVFWHKSNNIQKNYHGIEYVYLYRKKLYLYYARLKILHRCGAREDERDILKHDNIF